ncbi:MAG: alpha/beta fold hydrolase [Elainellaceae cyanobacterium]
MAKTVDVLGVPHTYELTTPTHQTCLVFVHGWLLSRTYWRPLIRHLQNHACLVYDLRGFGESCVALSPLEGTAEDQGRAEAELSPQIIGTKSEATAPIAIECRSASTTPSVHPLVVSPYSPAAYAQDLNRLLEALDIKAAWVIGHSLGGSIGLWAALQSPERIRGCICVNSGGGIYLKEEFEKFRNAGKQLVRLRPHWLKKLPLLDLLMARMNVARPIARQWGRQRIFDLVAAQPEAALGALLESTTEEEVHRLPHVVSHLPQPVYFIAGEADDIMEPKYVDHLASFHRLFRDKGQNVIKLPQCGHFAMIEQPERLAEEIKAILARHQYGQADIDGELADA